MPDLPFLGTTYEYPTELKTPYEYFKRFITDDMISYLANQSVLYYKQCNNEKLRNQVQASTPVQNNGSIARGRPRLNGKRRVRICVVSHHLLHFLH